MEMVNIHDKHRKVDCYLDNTLKKNEILLQRIDNDLAKYEREKNRYAGDRNNNNSDSSGNNWNLNWDGNKNNNERGKERKREIRQVAVIEIKVLFVEN